MIDYNLALLNHNDLVHSFFCMSKDDPTVGFEYDATSHFGPTYPIDCVTTDQLSQADKVLVQRLVLGSHLARHLRHELESQKGYTSTVGIATNKILAKLIGNVNKPKNQTTIMPPYEPIGDALSTVARFLDKHDIGKVPGVGFKLAQKIRAQVLGHDPAFSAGLVYGGTKENVTVGHVRSHPGMGPELLEELLGGPGSQKGIGGIVWELLHGIDDSEVGKAKRVPSQISQEDSYMKYLRTFEDVRKQLHLLGERLIRRMQMDLLEDDKDDLDGAAQAPRRWMAHPRTLRLSTRPRPLPGPDGVRARTFHRISHSAPMPNFVFNLNESTESLADRLVETALVPMFRKLHHEKTGWNLSLINIAATNMAETAAETKDSEGRDIGRMFRRQDDVLKDFKVTADPNNNDFGTSSLAPDSAHRSEPPSDPASIHSHCPEITRGDAWESEGSDTGEVDRCEICQSTIPAFALAAHRRFHEISS
jgi:DNA polymerase iota